MTIDKELESLIPPLSKDEYDTLKNSIISEGCREPLVLWGETIVDGHNRYHICTENGIEFKTVNHDFENKNDAKLWMIDNQSGRRNLTDGWKFELRQIKKKILSERAKNTQGTRTDIVSNNDTKLFGRVRDEIASDLGWSTGKTAQADYVWKHGDDEVKEKVKSGDFSINQAYTTVKKEVRTEEIKEKRKELADKGLSVSIGDRWNVYNADIRTWKSDKKYDFIITDPPYPREFLPLWSILSKRANEWLKDGGLLIAMSGQAYLSDIYKLLSENMTYYWTASYYLPGQPTPLRHVNVNTTWKPLLIYRKGEYKGKIFGDVFRSDGNDKEHHKWGQSESGMFDIISKICLPGQSILDPFCGAGTTGIAALKHGCLFDGIELDIENVNISKGRLNDI